MSILKPVIAVFDGSLEGLLTCVFSCYNYDLDNIYEEQNLQKNLLNDFLYIRTNLEKSERVKASIEKKLSKEVFSNIKIAFKSSYDDIYIWIFRYIKFAYEVGAKIDLYIHFEAVSKILSACKFYNNEVHMLSGTTRFAKTAEGVLYAKIEPKNDLIEDLSTFFYQRIGTENWIIHDVKRGLVAVYNKEQIFIRDFPKNVNVELAEDEEIYKDLWYQFFHSISIKERQKTKLQTQLMAKRYQANANEFNDLKSQKTKENLNKK